jgi:ankyrin repeat protein
MAWYTALHGAAACRSTLVLRYRLEKGAPLNAKNNQGFIPTDEAELTRAGRRQPHQATIEYW